MLIPKVGGFLFGIENFNPGSSYRYAMGIGASLMLGWTVLLIWADRKPLERKGILLLTVFPVVFGLFISGLWAVSIGFIAIEKMILIWLFQIGISILYIYSYLSVKT
ncbi:hypothetical protein ACFL52_01490 [Candidatus Margulisiibacteriota bacterium]